MKYKYLLTGKNNVVIDDFFTQLNADYSLLTTSLRFDDMANHMELFQPDLVVLCLGGENSDDIKCIKEFKRKLDQFDVKLVIVGEAAECNDFQSATNNLAHVVITRPITISGIRDILLRTMADIEKARKEAAEAEEQARKEAEKAAEINRRKHILVVDDEPIMLKLLQEQLTPLYDVATAVSGKIALKFLEKKHTDLVLLDYEMPVENGPMVLEKIRANPETENLPVIFITGVTDKAKIQQVLSLKPQGYVLKPVEHDKLLDTVGNYFKGAIDKMQG